MKLGTLLEWGAIIVGVLLVWRFADGLIGSNSSNNTAPGWQPGYYPYQYGGGVVYFTPGLTGSNFRPWGPRKGYPRPGR